MQVWKRYGVAGLVIGGVVGCGSASSEPAALEDSFTGPDGLIAAEKSEPTGPTPWDITSGSLFRDRDEGWTGRPDDGYQPGDTGSAVFRMVSQERDFADVHVSMRLKVDGLSESDRTPAQTYDGAHIWVRYKSDRELYAVSVDRRDGTMVVKKKCVGGDENGGTYYELDRPVVDAPIPFGQWQQVDVSVRDLPDGSVSISASRDGRMFEAVDHGVGCAPLRGEGGVGIRGDNADLRFDDIRVVRIETSP
jgi:hypothetical protein